MLRKKTPGGGAAAASLMGCDHPAPSPPTSELAGHIGNGGRPSSLLLSPRSRLSVDAASSMAPTSMAEQSKNPTCSGPRNLPGGSIGNRAAGLAGVLVAGEADGGGHSKNGRVLLGMRLRVQLPPPPAPGKGRGDPPGSPIEFGVKNRDAQLALFSPVQLSSPAARAARRGEVEELSEDYTCVISRGPKPKTTHIFEDRVVESPAGAGDGGGDACCLLSSCRGCDCNKDALLLHRDEKAFCSSQHQEEMISGKRIRNSPDA
ncbi:hypothetical protein ACP70R_014414 [Stipagrostis hirtigluma subsp. patula]